MEKHFLEAYKTQDKPEAKRAAERKEQRTGERGIVRDRSERIQAYLERLENVFLNSDPRVRERNIELLKPAIYENTLIKEENFPESHFDFQKQLLVDRGFDRDSVGHHFDGEKREQEMMRVRESQRLSLDNWIDYLTGDDCRYPADVKYFAIQGVLRLGNFDTEKYSFTKRRPETTAPFAEVDREALSIVLGAVETKNHRKPTNNYSKDLLTLIENGNSFGDMYALVMRELDQKAEKTDLLPITEGEWKVFEKGSDPQRLVDALAGKRSNLCIADIGSASSYLNQGSVEVYFSYNRAKQPTLPRIAVASAEDRGGVYEVRGTYNKNEDIDPEMEESGILMEKLKNLPNGESFAKKDADMKQVTELYKKCFREDKKTKEKTFLDPVLAKEELQFLYEINAPIEGFGFRCDPRIAELLAGRNPEEDMPVVFGCTKDQIAHAPGEINEKTKAYVGQLEPDIFQKLPENLEYVYTSFPDKKIRRENIKVGGKSAEELITELEAVSIKISTSTRRMLLDKTKFVPTEHVEDITLVCLTVGDLGLKADVTTSQIFKRAQELGLEFCPPDIGPSYRLRYRHQPLDEWFFIGMKPIIDSGGFSNVFRLGRSGNGLLLGDWSAEPSDTWHPDRTFAFRLRRQSK